ncbi:hypothetical protein [Mesorhizobium sp. WSM3873]|uniref:HoxN/HupN/NixA family nickel/cobalt transporter n=1 Tax=Mesorhizobium sp. WSM3873 TaxID=1854056 RepID=UPI001FD92BC6|nr:hypothetical protein [Mesorhizobium sp. WSM3873]
MRIQCSQGSAPGAAHALTPGHSKAVFATYLNGSYAKVARGLLFSITFSVTHVTIAVIIAMLSLPLVSIALGTVGRAPLLEDVSRGLLGLIGVWMIWRAFGSGHRHKHEGEAVGFMADPVPVNAFRHDLRDVQGRAGGGSSLCRNDDDRRCSDPVHRRGVVDPVPRTACAHL